MKPAGLLAPKLLFAAFVVAGTVWLGILHGRSSPSFKDATSQPGLVETKKFLQPQDQEQAVSLKQTMQPAQQIWRPLPTEDLSVSGAASVQPLHGHNDGHANLQIGQPKRRVTIRTARNHDVATASSTGERTSGSSGIVRHTSIRTLPTASLPYVPSQPAAWADPGNLPTQNPELDPAIQQEAERLAAHIGSSGLSPDSPEYRALWDTSVADSDHYFRARYGKTLWLAHHIQAYHLATARAAKAP